MAASSADDIPAQLAALLGKRAVQVRKTDETPPRISVIDVATLVTGKNARNAARDVVFVRDRHPEVSQKLSHFLFSWPGPAKYAGDVRNRDHRARDVAPRAVCVACAAPGLGAPLPLPRRRPFPRGRGLRTSGLPGGTCNPSTRRPTSPFWRSCRSLFFLYRHAVG